MSEILSYGIGYGFSFGFAAFFFGYAIRFVFGLMLL